MPADSLDCRAENPKSPWDFQPGNQENPQANIFTAAEKIPTLAQLVSRGIFQTDDFFGGSLYRTLPPADRLVFSLNNNLIPELYFRAPGSVLRVSENDLFIANTNLKSEKIDVEEAAFIFANGAEPMLAFTKGEDGRIMPLNIALAKNIARHRETGLIKTGDLQGSTLDLSYTGIKTSNRFNNYQFVGTEATIDAQGAVYNPQQQKTHDILGWQATYFLGLQVHEGLVLSGKFDFKEVGEPALLANLNLPLGIRPNLFTYVIDQQEAKDPQGAPAIRQRRDDPRVAGEFGLFAQRRADPPEQRIPPPHDAGGQLDPAHQVIASLDVGQLVHQQPVDAGVGGIRRHVRRPPLPSRRLRLRPRNRNSQG